MDRASPIERPSSRKPPSSEASETGAAVFDAAVPRPLPHGERRLSARSLVELDVSLHARTDFYGGFTENLSRGGTFIATHLLKPVGESVSFSLFLPQLDFTVRGVGEVRWHRAYSESANSPPGMGIRFVRLETGSEDAIARYLSRCLSAP